MGKYNYKIIGIRYVGGESFQEVDDEVSFYAIAPEELGKLIELVEAYGTLDEEWANPLPIIEILDSSSRSIRVGILVSIRTATGKIWETYPWASRIDPETEAKWIPEGHPFSVRSTKFDISIPENYAFPYHNKKIRCTSWHYPIAWD